MPNPDINLPTTRPGAFDAAAASSFLAGVPNPDINLPTTRPGAFDAAAASSFLAGVPNPDINLPTTRPGAFDAAAASSFLAGVPNPDINRGTTRPVEVPGHRALDVIDLAAVAGRFGHLLHAAGLAVSPERSARFADVVRLARPVSTAELYWLGRTTLTSERDAAVFDAVFDQVFGGVVDVADQRGDPAAAPSAARPRRPPPAPGGSRRPRDKADGSSTDRPRSAGTIDGGGEDREDEVDGDVAQPTTSAEERLRHTDFASCTDDELQRIGALIAALEMAQPRRRSRRATSDDRGRHADLRRTLRRARRTGGEPVHIARRRPRDRPRRVVLIADVSGSMEPYARAYLALLHAAVRAVDAEAFVFATRLTCVTRALRRGTPGEAIARAGVDTPDWAGGTRISDALSAFVDGWGRRGVARRAVVVIVSDGWESGDPVAVGVQMARLGRLAHRIVWVNPRKAGPGYEPLAGGMAAALPHVDAFVSGHSLHALREVVTAIAAT